MRWYDWLFFGVLALLSVSAVGAYLQGSAECERKGGAYFCAHGSTCICLAPGVVIP